MELGARGGNDDDMDVAESSATASAAAGSMALAATTAAAASMPVNGASAGAADVAAMLVAPGDYVTDESGYLRCVAASRRCTLNVPDAVCASAAATVPHQTRQLTTAAQQHRPRATGAIF